MDDAALQRRRWWALAVLCCSLGIISLDNTVLNVAIPSLVRELHATTSELQYIIDGYTLVFAGLLLTTGSLGDRFGRRRFLSIGLGIFAFGSAISALATQPWQLIGTRALMGLGGAFIMPATLSLLTNIFTDARERGRAMSADLTDSTSDASAAGWSVSSRSVATNRSSRLRARSSARS